MSDIESLNSITDSVERDKAIRAVQEKLVTLKNLVDTVPQNL